MLLLSIPAASLSRRLWDAAHSRSGHARDDGEITVERALALQPDVILTDVQMPDLNGIDATRRILETSPHIAILMLTMFDEDNSFFAAMRAGARLLAQGGGLQ